MSSTPVMRSTSLTLRRQKFVSEYVETGNATQAARLAGYAERSAHVTGSRLLRNDKVAAAIEIERQTLRARLERPLYSGYTAPLNEQADEQDSEHESKPGAQSGA